MGEARQLAERYYQSFADNDFETATSCFADECVTVTPAGTFNVTEHEAFGRAFKTGLPDAHMELVRAVEAGEEIYITGRFKGLHTKDLVTPDGILPASGNTLDMRFADYFRIEAGKIVEHEVIWDQMTMMGQLGALSHP